MEVTAVLDDFAGSGWGVALQERGIDELGVELMDEAVATRKAANMTTIYRDVWEPHPAPIVEGYLASPPCQTFSNAGRGSGVRDLDEVLEVIDSGAWADLADLRSYSHRYADERTALVLVPLWRTWQVRPGWIALEQVPAVLPIWERIADELRGWGYSVWTGVMKAERYGVPQTRRRAVLIAKLHSEAREPVATHSEYHTRNPTRLDAGVLPWVSMAEALKVDGRNGTHEIEDRQPWKWAHTPATTIAGDPRITAREHHYHGEQSGTSFRLTAQEAAILQTYPADFPFAGTQTAVFRQIGNAVPPLLAGAIIDEARA